MKAGFRDGIPIGLAYFAVSFSLGIAARNAGLTAFESFLASMLCNASAGEYAGFTCIAAHAAYWEIALLTLIANARYLLMSFAMSQRLHPNLPFRHRFLLGYYLTDELFGIAISRPGYVNPFYTYGAVLFAGPCWAIGTALGNIAGNLLNPRIVSAFSVSLYGMFLAIFIPPARKNKVILGLIISCFLLSYGASILPPFAGLSEGTRIILLTILIAGLASVCFPLPETEDKYQQP